MGEIVSERAVECHGDLCSVWNVLTDTDRLNRAVGMEKIELMPLSDASAARYLASTRLGGFPVEYEERPYEWVYLQSFKVLRKMRSGPVESMEMAFLLDRNARGGTDVKLRLTMVPRITLLNPIIRFRASQTLKKFEREIHRIDAAIEAGSGPPSVSSIGAVHEEALERAAQKLFGASDSDLSKKVVEFVRTAGDLDVSRIRPFALADEWSAERREVLGTCLRAVQAGLLDLRWEVVCPSCRTATEALPSLASLTDHGACQLCELSFSLDLDEAVEATFAPTKAVRDVDTGPYCIGGPARTPHVVSQAILPPSGKARLASPTEPGRYRLFVRGGRVVPVELVAGAPEEVAVDAGDLGDNGALKLAPGGVVSIANPDPEERHAKLERVLWAKQAATAREVTAMPGFRRDFSADVLRPGTALRVSRVALFFSDLTASTQLYSTVGDAAAFKLVQDHFDVVTAAIEQHHGTLVKTIGDAVMAAFADEIDGVRACVDILHAFEEFRRTHPNRALTHIKIGLYAGACYAVTANRILDYFGQSVNIAARLQSEARSGELILGAELADHAIAAKVLPEGLVRERYDAKLKGVEGSVRAARIRVV